MPSVTVNMTNIGNIGQRGEQEVPGLPIHFSEAVVDIERFAARSGSDQEWLRARMYEVLAVAADGAGIGWRHCQRVDRGDSVAVLIPGSVSKVIVADGFIRELHAALRTYNRRSQAAVAMRMRVALHAGELSYDGKTWVGTELNTACRLVDLPALRAALAAEPGAHLALCVSDLWFQTVVQQHSGLDHRNYTPITFVAKEIGGKAWLHVPESSGRHRLSDGDDAQAS
jgi:hypothetical protein